MNTGNLTKELKELEYREYMAMLYLEFCNSKGIDVAKESMGSREKEFNEWVSAMFQVNGNYANLVSYMVDDASLVGELGKGRYNSVVPNLNEAGIETIAITPYINTFDEGKVVGYNGKIRFAPRTGETVIRYESPEIQTIAPNINPMYEYSQIDTLITHLPIGDVSIRPLVESSRQYNDVAIGAYGFIDDKNRNDKLRLLKDIKEKIESFYCVGCDDEYIIENGSYLYLLKSNQKTKVLERVLSR